MTGAHCCACVPVSRFTLVVIVPTAGSHGDCTFQVKVFRAPLTLFGVKPVTVRHNRALRACSSMRSGPVVRTADPTTRYRRSRSDQSDLRLSETCSGLPRPPGHSGFRVGQPQEHDSSLSTVRARSVRATRNRSPAMLERYRHGARHSNKRWPRRIEIKETGGSVDAPAGVTVDAYALLANESETMPEYQPSLSLKFSARSLASSPGFETKLSLATSICLPSFSPHA